MLCGNYIASAQINSSVISGKDEDVVVYDTDTDSYLYYKKGEEKAGKPYKVLSREEFNSETIKNSIGKSFLQKRNDARSATSLSSGGLPSFRRSVNNDAFEKVFGGSDVVVEFNGMVDVNLGVKSTYINNPLTPPSYRRTTSPSFETKYRLNLTGKIGDRINMNFIFDPTSTFDFETNLHLAYKSDEDDIIQNIELGNISMPLSNSLIMGSQSLFGGKIDLRLGKLDVTLLASQQKGQAKTIEVKGGAQSQEFELRADEYRANQHFFLSHYFRDHYEQSLSQRPLIVSGVNITRLEVYVTNRSNSVDIKNNNNRNIVAFMDLGEPSKIYNNITEFGPTTEVVPSNAANRLYQQMTSAYNLRNFSQIAGALQALSVRDFTSGKDYEKLERARMLRAPDPSNPNSGEYTYNSQLGFISLNSPLHNDEVLAVAFEYTYNGKTYRVGELSTSGTTGSDSTLIVKLLKGTILTPRLPTWDLMMKNIYELNASQLNPNNFVLNIFYEDSQLGTSVPYISEGPIDKVPLITVLDLDKLNQNNDPYPDGIFDFMQGITVETSRARIIFPVLEPFGSALERKFKGDPAASKYVYQELYDSTLTKAREIAEKNKFHIKGFYEASSRGDVSLGALNVAPGSVIVTAGGMALMEGVDYQVNYILGTVAIINLGLLESGIPISIKLEDRADYSLQTKTMLGANLNYRISKNFNLGGTILHLNEKPTTQKVAYGEDPVSNMIWGLNTSYMSESKVLSNLMENLSFLNTSGKSNINFNAEFAHLTSGQARGIKGKVFIDDFDGSKSSLDLRNYMAWKLASVPQGQPDLFPEGSKYNDVSSGFNRAKLSWYWIDPELLRSTSNTPAYYRQNPGKYQENLWISNVPVWDIYPNRQLLEGTPHELQVLNLNYYPDERGPYNYDFIDINNNGKLKNPESRWAGIMMPLPITDLESANYDYIEFWVLDPHIYNPNSKGGDFYINLGTVSEDILRDGHKSHEQGIPYPYDTTQMIRTAWGFVPKTSALVNTFDSDAASRRAKDIGLDGMNSEIEAYFFRDFIQSVSSILSGRELEKLKKDPSSDDFIYYRDPVHDNEQSDIMRRYKDFNNPEGNSSDGANSQVSNLQPDMEDINRDNTMEENESYFQYHIKMTPRMKIGENFIVDIIEKDTLFPNAGLQKARWYQFRIPLNEYQKSVGAISDFKSVRFMRMFLKNFSDTTVLRFASLELVRSEWRKYDYSLMHGQEGLTQPEISNSSFDVSVVNIEENSMRKPVNYVLPPNTDRVIDVSTVQERELNEQAMQLVVKNLADGDAKAVYKTIMYDFRQYRRLQMDVHAEALDADFSLQDDDLSLFVRLGSDMQNNYYEYEIPLKLTPHGYYTDRQRLLVWPQENMLDISLTDFSDLKAFRNANGGNINAMYEEERGGHIIRVKGNPNLGQVKIMMIGVRNPIRKEILSDMGVSKSGTVWVNELRLTDFENKGGWAANANMSVNLADFGTVSLSGNVMTAGFGGLEQSQAERSQEDVYSYNILSSLELGKFFSQKIGLSVPVFLNYSERFANPLYDPLSPDMKYRNAMDALNTKHQKDSLRTLAQDYTRRKSFNVTNMRISPAGIKQGGIVNITNLSLSFAFNETFQRNVNIEEYFFREYRGGLNYAYNIQPLYIEPFKKIGFLSSVALIKDFNFNLVPNQFTFTTDMYRMYSSRKNRNIAYPETKLPEYYSKDFTWTRMYNLDWNLAKSLTFKYNASNIARIDEPEGMVNRRKDPTGYNHWKDSTWTNILNFGRTVNFNQNFDLAWQVPFNKVKLIDWVGGTATYRGVFDWTAAPKLASNDYGYVYNPGNIISNARYITGIVDLDFKKLYNKSKFLRGINDEFDGIKKPEMVEKTYESREYSFRANSRRSINHGLGTENVTVTVINELGRTVRAQSETSGKNRVYVTVQADTKAKVIVTGKLPKKDPIGVYSAKLGTRMLMMVRNAKIAYSQDEESILPGFMGTTKFIGLNSLSGNIAPGLDYVMGGQATDFLIRAKEYGWITNDSTMINPYIMRKSTKLTVQLTVEPVKDFQIKVSGLRNKTTDLTTFDITSASGGVQQMFGSFSISTISMGTAFEKYRAVNNYESKAFNNFNRYRKDIAWRMANKRSDETGTYNSGGGEYPTGYSGLSQEAIIPAFLAAYTGQSSSNISLNNFWKIPLPNWDINYRGFSRSEFFKQFLKSGDISHRYSSEYSINAYNWNSDFQADNFGYSWVKNQMGDYISQNNILNVSIVESFNPLIGFNFNWVNNLTTNFSVTKNRTLGLSLSNFQVLELKNLTYAASLGYNFTKVPLIFRLGENSQRRIDTNLKLTAGLRFGNTQTFIRSLEETEQATQISAGYRSTVLSFSADYELYNGITLRAFYDQDVNNPWVSAISISTTHFGFGLKINLSPK